MDVLSAAVVEMESLHRCHRIYLPLATSTQHSSTRVHPLLLLVLWHASAMRTHRLWLGGRGVGRGGVLQWLAGRLWRCKV